MMADNEEEKHDNEETATGIAALHTVTASVMLKIGLAYVKWDED